MIYGKAEQRVQNLNTQINGTLQQYIARLEYIKTNLFKYVLSKSMIFLIKNFV